MIRWKLGRRQTIIHVIIGHSRLFSLHHVLLSLAVDRKFNREEADFIPIVAWRKTAEFVAKYFRKGQRVIVAQGRIKVDQYTDKEGNKRSRFSVVADEVEFADSKRAPEDRPAGSVAAEYMENGGFEYLDGEDGDLPF